PEEAAKIRAWFEGGGNVFILASPVPDTERKRMLPTRLGAITEAAGIALDEDFVFETDARRKLPGGFGQQVLAEESAMHEITAGMAGERNQDIKILMTAARSLSRGGDGKIAPSTLLSTSKDAYAMTDFFAWAEKGGPPEKSGNDKAGPLVLAMAS